MGASRWTRLYENSPIVLQNLACSLAGWNIRRTRYGKTFQRALAFLEESERWSRSDLDAYQDEQLRSIIQHAYDEVPYYREVFDKRKLVPEDIRTVADLPKLPLLQKQTIRDRWQDLHARDFPKRRMVYHATGGTTGKALAFAADIDTQPWHFAVQWRHRGRFGCRFGDEFVVFSGKNAVPLKQQGPPIWRRNRPMHQTYVTAHHLTERNMEPLVEYLQTREVAFYCGYPSALYLVAVYLLDHDIRLRHPLRMVSTNSETVLPHQRSALTKAFDCPVGDHYAATESCVYISECERNTYHVDMEYAAVEFLEVEGAPGDTCRIVGTGFHNPAMPLIRYDIGDLATIGQQACPCGRSAPTVERIDGRIESYLVTPEGRRLGRLDWLFKDRSAVSEAQLLQDAIDHVTIKVVRSPNYATKDEDELLTDMREFMGTSIRIDVDYVDTIPREANGKFRQVISNVFRDRYRTALSAGQSEEHQS